MSKLSRIAMFLLNIEEDIRNRFRFDTDNRRAQRRPTPNDFEYVEFEQLWGDTSCGLGGIAGQSMTVGNVIVAIPRETDQPYFVYFEGKFAYCAEYSDELAHDIRNHSMQSVTYNEKYNVKR